METFASFWREQSRSDRAHGSMYAVLTGVQTDHEHRSCVSTFELDVGEDGEALEKETGKRVLLRRKSRRESWRKTPRNS